jgi:hypothetical protein
MTPLADKSAAWAAEMRAAQEATLPTVVVDGDGTGVYLVAGGADVDLLDADPAPGVTHRWAASATKPSDMAKVVDRQLGQPQVTVPLGNSLVRTQGTFAGPSGKPFSLCHLAGNKFWFQGGKFSFVRLAGQTDTEEGPSFQYEEKEVIIPSKAIFADNGKPVVIGLEVSYAAQTGGLGSNAWNMEFRLAQRTIDSASDNAVETKTVCGMLLNISGSAPNEVSSLTPFGDNFFPLIALHTVSDNFFWQQQIGGLPNQYINPNKGFIWWP